MKTTTLLFTVALTAGLVACGEQTAERTMSTETVAAPDRGSAVITGAKAYLDATLAVVKAKGGDVTALGAKAGAENVDGWLARLDGVAGAEAVKANLGKLRESLAAPKVNGAMTGMLLVTLAEDSREAANATPGIGMLANALRDGGQKLLDATVKGDGLLPGTLRAVAGVDGDITTLPAAAAVENIDGWIAKLRMMDGTGAIVDDLDELKEELSESSIDGDDVSELLFDLAGSTRKLANGNAMLETLGYALEAGAWRVKPDSQK